MSDLLDDLTTLKDSYTTSTNAGKCIYRCYYAINYLETSGSLSLAISHLIEAIEFAELVSSTDSGYINCNVAIAKVYKAIVDAVADSDDPDSWSDKMAGLDAAYDVLLEEGIIDDNLFAQVLAATNDLYEEIQNSDTSTSKEQNAVKYFLNALEKFEDEEYVTLLKNFQYGIAWLARVGTDGVYFSKLKDLSYSVFKVFYGSVLVTQYSEAIKYLSATTYMYAVFVDLYSDSVKPAVDWDCGTDCSWSNCDPCDGYSCTQVTSSMPTMTQLECILTRYNHETPGLVSDANFQNAMGDFSISLQDIDPVSMWVVPGADQFTTAVGYDLSASTFLMEAKLYATYVYFYMITKNTISVSTVMTNYNTFIYTNVDGGVLDVTESIATPLQHCVLVLDSLVDGDNESAITYMTSALAADLYVTDLDALEANYEVVTGTYEQFMSEQDSEDCCPILTAAYNEFVSKYSLLTYTGEDGVDLLPYIDIQINDLYDELLAAGSSTDFNVMAMYYLDQTVTNLALENYAETLENFQYAICFAVRMEIDIDGYDEVNMMMYNVFFVISDFMMKFDELSTYQEEFTGMLYSYAYYSEVYSGSIDAGESTFPAYTDVVNGMLNYRYVFTTDSGEYVALNDLLYAAVQSSVDTLGKFTYFEMALSEVAGISDLDYQVQMYIRQMFYILISEGLSYEKSSVGKDFSSELSALVSAYNSQKVMGDVDTTYSEDDLSTLAGGVSTDVDSVSSRRSLSTLSMYGLHAAVANQVAATPTRGYVGAVTIALAAALRNVGVEDKMAVQLTDVAVNIMAGISEEATAAAVAVGGTFAAVGAMVAATYVAVSSGVVSLADSGLTQQAYGIGEYINTMGLSDGESSDSDSTGTETKDDGTVDESDDSSDDDSSDKDTGGKDTSAGSGGDDEDGDDEKFQDSMDDDGGVDDPDEFELVLQQLIQDIISLLGITDELTMAAGYVRDAGQGISNLYRNYNQYGASFASLEFPNSGAVSAYRLQGAIDLMTGNLTADTSGAEPLLRALIRSLTDILNQAATTFDTEGSVDLGPLNTALTHFETLQELAEEVAAGDSTDVVNPTTVDFTDIDVLADTIDDNISDLGIAISGTNLTNGVAAIDALDGNMTTAATDLATMVQSAIDTGDIDIINNAADRMETFQGLVQDLLRDTRNWDDALGSTTMPSEGATAIEEAIYSMSDSASSIRAAQNAHSGGVSLADLDDGLSDDDSSTDGLNVTVLLDVTRVEAGVVRIADFLEAAGYLEDLDGYGSAVTEVHTTTEAVSNAVTYAYISQAEAIQAGDTVAIQEVYELVNNLQTLMSRLNMQIVELDSIAVSDVTATVESDDVSSFFLSMQRLRVSTTAIYEALAELEPNVVADASIDDPFSYDEDDPPIPEEDFATGMAAAAEADEDGDGLDGLVDPPEFIDEEPLTDWDELADGNVADALGEIEVSTSSTSIGQAINTLETEMTRNSQAAQGIQAYRDSIGPMLEMGDYVGVRENVQALAYYVNRGVRMLQYATNLIETDTAASYLTRISDASDTLRSFISEIIRGQIGLKGTPQEFSSSEWGAIAMEVHTFYELGTDF